MKVIHGIFILFILSVLSTFTYGQNFELESIGLGGGVFLPQKEWDAGYYIELNGEFGEVLDFIFITPFIDYKRSMRSVEFLNETTDIALQYLSFGSKFIGYLDSQPKGLYLGTDISFNVISSETRQVISEYESNIISSLNHTKVGLSVLMGYLFKFETVSVSIQSRYVFIQGGFNIFQLGLGCNYIL